MTLDEHNTFLIQRFRGQRRNNAVQVIVRSGLEGCVLSCPECSAPLYYENTAITNMPYNSIPYKNVVCWAADCKYSGGELLVLPEEK